MANQSGYIFKARGSWFGRYRETQIIDGVPTRVQVAVKLCAISDRYKTKSQVRPLLADRLKPANEGKAAPESTLALGAYVADHFMPYAVAELSPSTAHGYKGLWRMYLAPHVETIVLRDFRCVDATKTLAALHREHALSRKSLRHCKGLLSSIFTHAKQTGVVDGINPITDAGIPRAAAKSAGTHAYSIGEISIMLHTLTGTARLAVALMFFTGLRPGEARGLRWSDYDAEKGILKVHSSIWRRHETAPKTEASSGVIPVCDFLAAILVDAPRIGEFILSGPSGVPADLHNLSAREVVPGLKRCECHEKEADHKKADHAFKLDESIPVWRGWYACRRGLPTAVTTVDTQLAAKSLLRHANISTTQAHYIKSVPAEAVRAVGKLSDFFQGDSSRPN
jgi:integrase